MYTILVTKNKRYYFATRDDGLDLYAAREIYNQFLATYTEAEGYQVDISRQSITSTDCNEYFTGEENV